MLGQEDAELLLGLCQEQIDSYGNPDAAIDGEDLELLAESLSGLGFYVEAMEQQRPDRQRLIAPLLAKRLGEAPSSPSTATPRPSSTLSTKCATRCRRSSPKSTVRRPTRPRARR
jgi:chemosensory pili system protein ChpA (sensor histidine kinase/response regulator)